MEDAVDGERRRLFNHAELVYAHGERDLVTRLFEALGCRVVETGGHTTSERRLLAFLCVWLILGSLLDLILSRHPGWIAHVIGQERIEDLIGSGGHEPEVRAVDDGVLEAAPSVPPAAPRSRSSADRRDRKLPYDRDGRLNVNEADAAALILLNGVGPVLAARIRARRAEIGSFATSSDLLSVRGIGPKTLAKLLPQVTLGAAKDSLPEDRTGP